MMAEDDSTATRQAAALQVVAPNAGGQILQVRYFAWVRERTGISEETVEVPESIATVGELIDWLKLRGPEFEAAFEKAEIIRAALDQTHVKRDARLAGAREIAFFPPVTGG